MEIIRIITIIFIVLIKFFNKNH